MEVQVRCPNLACGQVGTFAQGALGHTVRCRWCGATFRLAPSPDTGPPSAGGLPGQIGRFLVQARLGAGAFGTVYRAHDVQLGREVALKVAQPDKLDSPQRVERFLREARAAARLQHPNIVPVFDLGQAGDQYYIASALITGRTLAELRDERRLDLRAAVQVVRDLADALDCAHAHGIVH